MPVVIKKEEIKKVEKEKEVKEEEEEEKYFENYVNLSDVRRVLIEKMEPDDRCRLTRCSSLCYSEAKTSTNYMYSLKISKSSPYQTEIEVLHDPDRQKGHGHFLKYERGRKFCLVEYTTLTNQLLWQNTVYGAPKNRLHNYFEYFKYLLKYGQKSIKNLYISAKAFDSNFDFGINHLTNLKELGVESKFLKQFLPKLQRPLDNLYIYDQEGQDLPSGCTEKVLQVQNTLHAPYAKFDYEKFLQLSATCASIHIGRIKEAEIADFIKSWQKGKEETYLVTCTWNLKNSDFKVDRLLKLLGAVLNESGNCRIDRLKEDGKHIMLYNKEDSFSCVWKD